jgi:hypothetical protein
MKALIILVLGIAVFACGSLFALQGADLVHWPLQSAMLGNRDWIERGVVVMLIGVALILTARRIRQNP